MGIAIFIKSRLIPRRDAIYRVRLSNMNVANHGNTDAINRIADAINRIADAINLHCGRDKPHCGRDKSRPYSAANGATARSKMPLT